MRSINPYRQAGLSLVELMIAITLSTLLMLGVTQIFLSSKETYVKNQELSEIQENGRFALELLVRDIANAGYQGQCSIESVLSPQDYTDLCSDNNDLNSSCLPRNHLDDSKRSIWSQQDGAVIGWSSGKAPSFIQVPAGSDGLFIQFAAGGSTHYRDGSGNKQDEQIKLDTTEGIYSPLLDGDIGLIADGRGCDLFKNKIDNTSLNNDYIKKDSSHDWTSYYNNGFEVLRFESRAYYIDKDEVDDVRSLFRARYDYDNTIIEQELLVSGVKKIQLEYGVAAKSFDATDDAPVISKYVTADEVNNWQAVLAVRVTLTVVAKSGLQKDFSTLVVLRNRFHEKSF
ncbi:MAG TPA: PilW family protein [Thiopseudomonas sp.]|nr:PilW family protein [Thiopseudomonas sp.]